MGLRCGKLEGRNQGWGDLGEEEAGAAGSCRGDVPAPHPTTHTHTPHQLPEQNWARTSEEIEASSLQVQNSNLVSEVQNSGLCSKTFCSACVGGFLSSLTSLFPHHTCKMQHPCRTITAGEEQLCSGYAGAPIRHRALGQPAVSLWGICPSTMPNSGLTWQLSFIIFLPLCANEQGNIHPSMKGAWPRAPEQHLSGVNKGQSAQPTALFSPSPLRRVQIWRKGLSLDWRTKQGSVTDSIKPRGTPADKASLKQKGIKG